MNINLFKEPTHKTLYFTLALSFILNSLLLLNFFTKKDKYLDPLDINVLETYELSESLSVFREPNILRTDIPNKSPFGGKGLENTFITAGYLSKEYEQTFGTQHYAIDIIPNNNYYENLPIFLSRKRALVFATHNGAAEYLLDEFGANYLVITNVNETHRTLYVHLEASYVNTGDQVEAGQIIGVMGFTGKATGSHLHYALQIKNKAGYWQYANPLNYIN